MKRDRQLRLNEQISEEAAEWFIEFRNGDLDAAGRLAFDAWVRSSPEHLRAYLEIAAIWNEGDGLDPQHQLDIATLIQRGLAEDKVVVLPNATPLAPVRRKPQSMPSRFALAATVFFVVVAVGWLAWFQFHRAPVYATDVAEQRSIRLADGSTIELNSRSRLRVRFTDTQRTVDLLQGQALFKVARNPARPFVVRSDGTSIRAVGTQFDVYRKRGGTVVTVVEGRVAVLSGTKDSSAEAGGAADLHDAAYLNAGEQLTVTLHAIPAPARVNAAAATAWTQRQLVLESVSLAEVAEEFNRYSTRRLTVEDTGARELRLSGVFTTDPDFLVRYLRELPGVTVRETDTQILIVRHD